MYFSINVLHFLILLLHVSFQRNYFTNNSEISNTVLGKLIRAVVDKRGGKNDFFPRNTEILR